MGLIHFDLEMLRSLRQSGPPIKRIATIGRLSLFLQRNEIRRSIKSFQANPFNGYKWGAYCEPYLCAMLGAEEVVSIDASSYEGATIIHDMNKPIPSHLEGTFDLVLDGGTVEHVFNFPVAIDNIMRLLRVGGRVLTSSPANNLCGHGFFQFTPELMYRVFSEENGFRVDEMVLTEHRHASVELAPPRRAVRVKDPRVVGKRVMVMTHRPLMLKTLATKLAQVEIFQNPPQQSDYVQHWDVQLKSGTSSEPNGGMLRSLYRTLPSRFRDRVYLLRADYSLRNRELFEPYAFPPLDPKQ